MRPDDHSPKGSAKKTRHPHERWQDPQRAPAGAALVDQQDDAPSRDPDRRDQTREVVIGGSCDSPARVAAEGPVVARALPGPVVTAAGRRGARRACRGPSAAEPPEECGHRAPEPAMRSRRRPRRPASAGPAARRGLSDDDHLVGARTSRRGARRVRAAPSLRASTTAAATLPDSRLRAVAAAAAPGAGAAPAWPGWRRRRRPASRSTTPSAARIRRTQRRSPSSAGREQLGVAPVGALAAHVAAGAPVLLEVAAARSRRPRPRARASTPRSRTAMLPSLLRAAVERPRPSAALAAAHRLPGSVRR